MKKAVDAISDDVLRLEKVMAQIVQNKGQLNAETVQEVIRGLSTASLYIGVQGNQQPESLVQAQFALMDVNGTVVIPIYTRKEYEQGKKSVVVAGSLMKWR